MGQPVRTQYFLLNTAFPGSAHGGTSTVAPARTDSTQGWNMGTDAINNVCQMAFNTEVARTSTEWKLPATSSAPNNTVGNCWVIGPFNGQFSTSEGIQITMSVKAVTSAASQVGRFIVRAWKSDNPTGTGAILLSNTFASSSLTTALSTTVVSTVTASLSLSSGSFNHEYLFLHTQWGITTIASNVNADADWVFAQTASAILLPSFISTKTMAFNLIQEEFPA